MKGLEYCMRKTLLFLLIICMVMMICSCGNQTNKESSENNNSSQSSEKPQQDIFQMPLTDILEDVIENIVDSNGLYSNAEITKLSIENEQYYLGLSITKYDRYVAESAVATFGVSNMSHLAIARGNEGETMSTILQKEINEGLSSYYSGKDMESDFKGVSIQCGEDCFVFFGYKDQADAVIEAYKKTIKNYSFYTYSIMFDPIVFFPAE